MAETIQRIDSYEGDDFAERVELERIADVVEYRHFDADLVLDETRPATPEETAAHESWETSQNIGELRKQAEKAIDKNKAYAAIEAPTSAQVTKQVEELTKQMNGLIRQALQMFDDISDSVL